MTEPQTYTTPDGEQHLVDDHVCEDGWIGENLDGRPKPCPACRGHLRRRHADELGLSGYTPTRPSPHRKDPAA
jgi:hypothetical protein